MTHSLIEVQRIYSVTLSNPSLALENIFKVNNFRLLALDLFDLYLTSNYYKTRFGSTLPFVEFTTLVPNPVPNIFWGCANVGDGHQQSPTCTFSCDNIGYI